MSDGFDVVVWAKQQGQELQDAWNAWSNEEEGVSPLAQYEIVKRLRQVLALTQREEPRDAYMQGVIVGLDTAIRIARGENTPPAESDDDFGLRSPEVLDA